MKTTKNFKMFTNGGEDCYTPHKSLFSLYLFVLNEKRDRKADSEKAIVALKENGFDIKESAEHVAALYKKLVEERKR